MTRQISAHFNCSSKRREEFKEFQEFTNTETHTILQPGQTRWLTLHRCIERLWKQHNPLDLYFTNVVMEDASETSQSILITLKDPFTKAYLEFPKQALHEFNKVNALFQSERPLLYDMENQIGMLILKFANCYLTDDYVKMFKDCPLKLNPIPEGKRNPVPKAKLKPVIVPAEKRKNSDVITELPVTQKKSDARSDEDKNSPYKSLEDIYIGKLILE